MQGIYYSFYFNVECLALFHVYYFFTTNWIKGNHGRCNDLSDCPTATADAVITKKLGGNIAHITTYTILINIVNAILIPIIVPFIHPNPELEFFNSTILLLAAILLRYLSPKLHFIISHYHELNFYLWAVALALAMTVTTRSIMHSEVSFITEICLFVVSLVSCLFQFYFGRKIGEKFNDQVAA